MLLIAFGVGRIAQGCINDSLTKPLFQEKWQHPSLAEAILHPTIEKPNVKELTDRLRALQAKPDTNNPAWWNDLAGAYLRLGKPADAAKILEPITNRFAGDYGLHANLGTAYHLLGRYADAEREIHRDTEINPDAHFGLEKYHLALLQYLSRDAEYRARHVYVDEATRYLFTTTRLVANYKKQVRYDHVGKTNDIRDVEKWKGYPGLSASDELVAGEVECLAMLSMSDEPPPYAANWDLENSTNFENGVIYMASLNQAEPAVWVMLGIASRKHRDYHLAMIAFEKAIQLGSQQSPILRGQIGYWKSKDNFFDSLLGVIGLSPVTFGVLTLIGLAIAYYIFDLRRRRRKKKQSLAANQQS